MPVKPIKPSEINESEAFPDEVIEAFNELIVKNMRNGESNFSQDEVARLIANKMNMSIEKVYQESYLDVEDVYRKVGWKVEADNPGYNESYTATFTFKKKKEK